MENTTSRWFTLQSESRKTLVLLLLAWLALSLSQTLHFYFYFEQSLWNSIRWSFRDWFVWFVIFAVIYKVLRSRAELTGFTPGNLVLVAALAILSGVLQTLIITSLDFIAGTASRPFWQDFAHFYSKRWLQYLFIFVIFWLLMLNYFFAGKASGEDDEEAVEGNEDSSSKIKINDGKNTFWFETDDIYSVESAGNYLCYHTKQGQLIARGALKTVFSELEPRGFLRVSRSHMVNRHVIASSQRLTRSKVELILHNGNTIPIGTTYWQSIKKQLLL